MMGSGRTRGWIIIGLDLLIVLVIYFIYSQFTFETTRTATENFTQEFHYEVQVEKPRGDTIPVAVSVANRRDQAQRTSLPNGLLVLLTDGQDRKFWSAVPIRSNSLTLSPGERRSWRYAPSLPRNDRNQSLYVEVFVDRDRQMRVRVPTS